MYSLNQILFGCVIRMKWFLVIFSVIGSVLSQSYGGQRLNPQRGAELITNRFAEQGTQGTVQGLQTIAQNNQNNRQGAQNFGQTQQNNGQGLQNTGQGTQNNGQGLQNTGQIQQNSGQGFRNSGLGLPIFGQGVQNTGLGQGNGQLSGQVLQNTRPTAGIQDYNDFDDDNQYFQNGGHSGIGYVNQYSLRK